MVKVFLFFVLISSISFADCTFNKELTESLQIEIDWMQTRLNNCPNDYMEGYRDAYLNILDYLNSLPETNFCNK